MNIHTLLVESNPFLTGMAILLLRVFIGICFVVHGLGKLGVVGTGSMAGFEGWLKSMNIPFAAAQARLAMASEILGGALLILGLLTRPAAALCLFTMVVASVIGHKGGGYLITNNPPGNEYAINLAAICAAMILLGPGMFSLDALLF
jgi:putative oxidoreductase